MKIAPKPSAQLTNRRRTELALPAQMMLMMGDLMRKQDHALRPDVINYLQRSQAAALQDLNQTAISQVARKIDEASKSLLHDLSPDDPIQGFLVVAMFVVVLIDEGLFPDPTNVVVTSALLTMEDAKVDPNWEFHERTVKIAAYKLLSRARLLGYYMGRKVDGQAPALVG